MGGGKEEKMFVLAWLGDVMRMFVCTVFGTRGKKVCVVCVCGLCVLCVWRVNDDRRERAERVGVKVFPCANLSCCTTKNSTQMDGLHDTPASSLFQPPTPTRGRASKTGQPKQQSSSSALLTTTTTTTTTPKTGVLADNETAVEQPEAGQHRQGLAGDVHGLQHVPPQHGLRELPAQLHPGEVPNRGRGGAFRDSLAFTGGGVRRTAVYCCVGLSMQRSALLLRT